MYKNNTIPHDTEESPRGAVANVLNCNIVVSEFRLHSRYYIHFRSNTLGKRYEPIYYPAMG